MDREFYIIFVGLKAHFNLLMVQSLNENCTVEVEKVGIMQQIRKQLWESTT